MLTSEDLENIEDGRMWYAMACNNDGKGYGVSDLRKMLEEEKAAGCLRFEFRANGERYYGSIYNGQLLGIFKENQFND